VKSFLSGVEGRTRSAALAGYTARLRERNDFKGLGQIYALTPPSHDRTKIASDHIRQAAKTHGLSYSLELVGSLDLKEEQTYSFIRLYGYIKDSRPQISESELEEFYELSRYYDSEQAAKAGTWQ
jgi:hypothetical protein